MQGQQIEKIKQLVNTSAILNLNERGEWLELLDLMNDKQLGELERILLSAVSKKPATESAQPGQKSSYVPLSGTSEDKPSFAKASEGKPKFTFSNPALTNPKLSHIVNFPRLDVLDNKAGKDISPNKPSYAKASEDKPGSSFSDKLKAMFTEKELPAGNPQHALELANAKNQPVAATVKPSALPKVGLPPVVPKPPAPVNTQNPSVVNIFADKVVLQQPDAQKGIPANLIINQPVSPPIQPEAAVKAALGHFQVVSQPTNPPGASNAIKIPEMVKPEPLTSLTGHLALPKVPLTLPHPAANKPATAAVAGLESLADLNSLNIGILEKYNLESLALKLKNLRAKYGYHDVVFNIEKSPLFKNYIQTGVELLAKQTDFEQLTPKAGAGNYLNRQQFEKLTDLLLEIQTG